jgi:hypothetical protein
VSLRRRVSIVQVLVPYSIVFLAAVLCAETSFGHLILGFLSLITLGAAVRATGVVGTSSVWAWAIATYVVSLVFWVLVLRVFLGMNFFRPVHDEGDLRP